MFTVLRSHFRSGPTFRNPEFGLFGSGSAGLGGTDAPEQPPNAFLESPRRQEQAHD